MRGHLIQICSIRKKARECSRLRLIAKIARCQSTHKLSQSLAVTRELAHAQEELKSQIDSFTQRAIATLKHRYCEHDNKCGKMLANLHQFLPVHWPALKHNSDHYY